VLSLSQLLLGFLVPAVVAAAVLLCAWRRPGSSGEPRAGIGGLAVASGYVVGQVGLRGLGPWPPVEASGWLPYVALAAALLGTFDRETGAATRLVLRLFGATVIVGGLWLLLRGRMIHAWSSGQSAAWLAGLGAGILLLWLALERGLPALPLRSSWLTLVVVAAGSAATITASGSLLLGLLGAALAAACTGAASVAAFVTSRRLERASTLALTSMLAGLVLAAYFYSDLPGWSALLLALAIVAPLLVPRRLLRRRGDLAATFLHGLAAAVPAGAALALAIAASPPLEPYY